MGPSGAALGEMLNPLELRTAWPDNVSTDQLGAAPSIRVLTSRNGSIALASTKFENPSNRTNRK
jgi:hypothetical protein